LKKLIYLIGARTRYLAACSIMPQPLRSRVPNADFTRYCDTCFAGPLTYQSLLRLPKPYRDCIERELMASRAGVSRGGEGGDESDSSSGIEQGDEPPRVRRPLSQCSDGSNASTGSGETEGPEEGFTSDHAQVIPYYCYYYHHHHHYKKL
jgi:hypothetical protein